VVTNLKISSKPYNHDVTHKCGNNTNFYEKNCKQVGKAKRQCIERRPVHPGTKTKTTKKAKHAYDRAILNRKGFRLENRALTKEGIWKASGKLFIPRDEISFSSNCQQNRCYNLGHLGQNSHFAESCSADFCRFCNKQSHTLEVREKGVLSMLSRQ